MLKSLRVRMRALLRKNRAEQDLDEELRYHLEKDIERNIARGLSPEEARKTALRGFGSIQQIKEQSRDAHGVRLVEEFWHDVRYGARMLTREPGFASVVVLILALGSGANTAVFSLVDQLLIRPLPVSNPDQLVRIEADSLNPHFRNNIFSYPDYADYRDLNQPMSGLLAYAERDGLLGSENPQRVSINYVSANYFDVLGVNVRGRGFLPDEERPGYAAQVAVLDHGLWRRLGSNPEIIGKSILLNGITLTVIGIAPRGFNGLRLERPGGVWVPVGMFPVLLHNEVGQLRERRMAWLNVVGRIQPGFSLMAARDSFDATARQVFEANTALADRTLPFNEKRIVLEPAGRGSSVLRTDLGPALTLLMVVVFLLLLTSCANVAGLMLARASAKQKEIAVRLALGAGRTRLARLLLAQGLLLSLIGATVGLVFAVPLRGLVLTFKPRLSVADTPLKAPLDGRILVFTLVVSAATAVLFGLAPFLQSRKIDVAAELKGSAATLGAGGRGPGLRSILVVGQVALAVAVLVAAGLLSRSLRNLIAIDLGFKPDNIVVLPLELPRATYKDNANQFYGILKERLRALPAVDAVSTASIIPLSGSVGSMPIQIEGRQLQQGQNLGVDFNQVGPGYHQLIGIPIVRGRGFDEHDAAGAKPVVIVNEVFARSLLHDEDPIGKRIRQGEGQPWLEIVGVARDYKTLSLTDPPPPHLDLPSLQHSHGQYAYILVRAAGDSASVIPAATEQVKILDPAVIVAGATTLASSVDESLAPPRMAAALIGVFGVVSLLLAGVGIYGVIAYAVNQRTREIGIRMALGARRLDVLLMVARRGGCLMLIGLITGIAGARASTHLMTSLLYGVGPGDSIAFAAAAVLVVTAGLLACYLPARRAASCDPIAALRYE